MLWRVSQLCAIQESSVSTALRSGRRSFPCKLRGITTSAPFQVVKPGDDTSAEDTSNVARPDHSPVIRRTNSEKYYSVRPRQKLFYTRCVYLLTPDQNASDPVGGNRYTNQRVSVRGVIKSIRKQKHGAFAHLTDGSCFQAIQVVLDSQAAASLSTGTCLRINGMWTASPAQGQPYELKAEEVRIFGTSDAENYPIQKKYHTPEFLRTVPHLRIRTPFHSVLARFRSACLSLLGPYFSKLDSKGGCFVQVQPPIITSSDCEGAGEVFTLVSNAAASTSEQSQGQGAKQNSASFFRTPKYLTVSSQLHLEAYAAELRNVWALSPTFRAERSDTPRHLAEFYMLELEMGHVGSLNALTGSIEHLIRNLVKSLIKTPHYVDLLLAIRASNEESAEEKVEELEKRWRVIIGERWKIASYSYCVQQLRVAAKVDRELFERRPEYGSSLQLEHERWIVQNIGKGRPIFVTHYPRAIKPFYMAPSTLAMDHVCHPEYQHSQQDHRGDFDDYETGEDTVACFDLLMPFGVSEVAGGSLREHRLENLIENMRESGMLKPKTPQPSSKQTNDIPHVAKDSADAYPFLEPGESLGSLKWYADLRRYGTMPHGGYGIGFDRLIAYLTGVHNLRDVVPFPRAFGRADC